jgi:hypothetical protein
MSWMPDAVLMRNRGLEIGRRDSTRPISGERA